MRSMTSDHRFLLGVRAAPLLALALAAVLFMGRGSPAHALVANPGFETGDLTGWTTGATTAEGIQVVGTDTINAGESLSQAPLEGDFMARLGDPQPSANETQPIGQNELIQQFALDQPSVKFAYNIWTYDYTGFDRFTIELRLVNSDTVIYSHSQQAWGAVNDTTRKNTGWQVVDIGVSQYQGQLAQLTISAGGSIDTLFAFWVYIDSAFAVTPPQVVDFDGVLINGFHPSRDPANQTINVRRPPNSGPFRIDVPVQCPDGSDPSSVTLVVGSNPPVIVALTLDAGTGLWGGNVPTPPGIQGQSFPLTLVIECDPQTITVLIGSITLVDPSGFVTNADTDEPIVGATVTLQRLEGDTFVTVNPFALVNGQPTVAPQINPELTDDEGHYAWDVIAGTYRVIVEAVGYVTQTSPEVTVPPPVLDLNVALLPLDHVLVGDLDCNDVVDAIDALKGLRYVSKLSVTQNQPCPTIGEEFASIFGDVDCDDDVDAIDSLKVSRFVAALPVTQNEPCDDINT